MHQINSKLLDISGHGSQKKMSAPKRNVIIQPKAMAAFGPSQRKRSRDFLPLDDIPVFIKRTREDLRSLSSFEDNQRRELDSAQTQIQHAQQTIDSLFSRSNERMIVLRKRLRLLSGYAADLSRFGRFKDSDGNTVLADLRRIDDERKTMLQRIVTPQWEKPHHFHMFAVEHFRGNKQPNLLDLAEVIPGRLAIVAVANFAQKRTSGWIEQFELLKQEITLLKTCLEEVEKQRTYVIDSLKEIKKMQFVMKGRMSRLQLRAIQRHEKIRTVGKPLLVTRNSNKASSPPVPKYVPTGRGIRRSYLTRLGLPSSKNTNKRPPARSPKEQWLAIQVDEYIENVRSALKELASDPLRSSNFAESEDDVAQSPTHGNKDWSMLAKVLGEHQKAREDRTRICGFLEDLMEVRESLMLALDDLASAYSAYLRPVSPGGHSRRGTDV